MRNLFYVFIFTGALLKAQTGREIRFGNPGTNPLKINFSGLERSVSSCYTLTTLTGTALSANPAGSNTVTAGCTPNAGYIFGSNCFKDKEKANYFAPSLYSGVSSPSVTAVTVVFYKSGNRGTGGVATSTVNLAIYSGSMISGPTGTPIVTTTANIGQIVAAQTGTNPFFAYTYNLPSPTAIPANGFFASVSIPGAAGDTAVIGNDPMAPTNLAWERWSDNNWIVMNGFSSWGPSLKGNMAILPVICGDLVPVGLMGTSAFGSDIFLSPNPSNGIVNIRQLSQTDQKLNVTVSDLSGRRMKDLVFEPGENNIRQFDLSGCPKGVYFITISNQTNKVVKKVILTGE